MNLGAPEFIFSLLVIPLLLFLFVAARRRSAAERSLLLDAEIEGLILPKRTNHAFNRRRVLLFLTFQFLAFALIRPQFGYQEVNETRNGIDLLFLVDVSKSMLAKDLSPSRLERVRFLILDLLSSLKGDRVGLVTFAGVSFLESPLTYDYGTFRLFLDDLSPDLIPVPGTNLASALREGVKAFGPKRARGGAIVLLTDGEDFSGDLQPAIEEVREAGIKVFTVGVGSEIGAPIPDEGAYKRDQDGKVVLSKLSEHTLEDIAKSTGGAYLGGSLSGPALRNFYASDIAPRLKRAEMQGGVVRIWNEYFQIPLLLALFCYLLLGWVTER